MQQVHLQFGMHSVKRVERILVSLDVHVDPLRFQRVVRQRLHDHRLAKDLTVQAAGEPSRSYRGTGMYTTYEVEYSPDNYEGPGLTASIVTKAIAEIEQEVLDALQVRDRLSLLDKDEADIPY